MEELAVEDDVLAQPRVAQQPLPHSLEREQPVRSRSRHSWKSGLRSASHALDPAIGIASCSTGVAKAAEHRVSDGVRLSQDRCAPL